ncbi:hypothetical protein TSOC_006698 [Tetrabaena socialis]|uniref:Uncharacterized protein n=1 Tax=Tetrabaena socialis TaxID=47790 RepID=A0A2J8A301_9CHLO|nr:hypothetical protein TSOC_006698 [Tetrabaena socialis]|eukprot:PNH06902.1 hypothetical protein TSOC_006698 [Tetrabaena socialis]
MRSLYLVALAILLMLSSAAARSNTFRAAGVPDPSVYYKGRFTNNLNWVDYLNETLARKHEVQVRNYAWGGASACLSNVSTILFPYVKDLAEQVEDLLADVKAGLLPKRRNAKLLPIIWIGTNDVQFALAAAARLGALPTPGAIGALIGSIVTCRLEAVKTLAAGLGAAARDIVLMPMVPLYTAPAVPDFLKPQPPAAPPQDAPSPPCFIYPSSTLTITPGVVPCKDPNDRAFYDNLHVSTRFHEWFATQGLLPRLQQLRLLPTAV